MKQVLIAYAVLLAVVLLGGFLFIYSGVYDVSADKEISSVKRWVLETTMERSVEARLDGIEVPELGDEDLVASGATHYEEMCVECHGAPGVDPGEIAEGLNPEPPDFGELEEGEDPRELFWVTKYGIEMTGMPAWGTSHDDESIWGMVAVMKQFHDMTPEAYRSLVESAAARGHHHGDNGHAREHGHHPNGGEPHHDDDAGDAAAHHGDEEGPAVEHDHGEDDHGGHEH